MVSWLFYGALITMHGCGSASFFRELGGQMVAKRSVRGTPLV